MRKKYLFETAMVLCTKQVTDYSGKGPIVGTACTMSAIGGLMGDSESGDVCCGGKTRKTATAKKNAAKPNPNWMRKKGKRKKKCGWA